MALFRRNDRLRASRISHVVDLYSLSVSLSLFWRLRNREHRVKKGGREQLTVPRVQGRNRPAACCCFSRNAQLNRSGGSRFLFWRPPFQEMRIRRGRSTDETVRQVDCCHVIMGGRLGAFDGDKAARVARALAIRLLPSRRKSSNDRLNAAFTIG